MLTTLLIAASVAGVGYFVFWATKRTLAEDQAGGKKRKRSGRR
ncbi:MAG: hypothetical protein AAFY71_19470 [Bacteroidota bacterium]